MDVSDIATTAPMCSCPTPSSPLHKDHYYHQKQQPAWQPNTPHSKDHPCISSNTHDGDGGGGDEHGGGDEDDDAGQKEHMQDNAATMQWTHTAMPTHAHNAAEQQQTVVVDVQGAQGGAVVLEVAGDEEEGKQGEEMKGEEMRGEVFSKGAQQAHGGDHMPAHTATVGVEAMRGTGAFTEQTSEHVEPSAQPPQHEEHAPATTPASQALPQPPSTTSCVSPTPPSTTSCVSPTSPSTPIITELQCVRTRLLHLATAIRAATNHAQKQRLENDTEEEMVWASVLLQLLRESTVV